MANLNDFVFNRNSTHLSALSPVFESDNNYSNNVQIYPQTKQYSFSDSQNIINPEMFNGEVFDPGTLQLLNKENNSMISKKQNINYDFYPTSFPDKRNHQNEKQYPIEKSCPGLEHIKNCKECKKYSKYLYEKSQGKKNSKKVDKIEYFKNVDLTNNNSPCPQKENNKRTTLILIILTIIIFLLLFALLIFFITSRKSKQKQYEQTKMTTNESIDMCFKNKSKTSN